MGYEGIVGLYVSKCIIGYLNIGERVIVCAVVDVVIPYSISFNWVVSRQAN